MFRVFFLIGFVRIVALLFGGGPRVGLDCDIAASLLRVIINQAGLLVVFVGFVGFCFDVVLLYFLEQRLFG